MLHLLSVVAESSAGLLWLFFPQGFFLPLAGALHLLAVSLATWVFAGRFREEKLGLRIVFPAAVSLFIFPFGIFFLVSYAFLTKRLHIEVASGLQFEVFRRCNRRACFWRPSLNELLASRPIIEILRRGSPDMRLQAALALQKGYVRREKAIPLLQEALSLRDHEIEILASTGITQAEKQLEDQVAKLLSEGEKQEVEDLNTLASLFYQYCQLGLAQGELRSYYLRRAVEYLRKSLEINPEQPETRIALARALLDLGEVDAAEIQIERAISQGYIRIRAYIYLAEIHFRRRHWAKLKRLCEWLLDQPVFEQEFRDIVAFWSRTCVRTSA